MPAGCPPCALRRTGGQQRREGMLAWQHLVGSSLRTLRYDVVDIPVGWLSNALRHARRRKSVSHRHCALRPALDDHSVAMIACGWTRRLRAAGGEGVARDWRAARPPPYCGL